MTFEFGPGGSYTSDTTRELLSALDHFFLSIVKLDLDSEKAVLLQCASEREHLGCAFDWERYLHFYRTLLEPDEVDKLSAVLSAEQLKQRWETGYTQYRADFSCRVETGLTWLELFARFDRAENGPVAYIVTRQSSDNFLLNRIVTQYIYSHCDCFYLLDAKNNSYTIFSGRSDVPRPVDVCQDYTAEVIRYAEQFVVPEERERVIRDMNIERVIEALEHQDVYAFTCGMWDEAGGHTYKRMEYRYYDRDRSLILLSRADVTDLHMENLRHMQALDVALKRAQIDPLTGLLNYREIREVVERELAQGQKRAALLFLDLDDFKKINDTQGHTAGDRALQIVAGIMQENIGPTDCAARIGGDEFVIFLSDIRDSDRAAICAQQICDQLSQVRPEGMDIHLSCSIGVSIAPDEGNDYESLVQSADHKVYRAKSGGKNQFAL